MYSTYVYHSHGMESSFGSHRFADHIIIVNDLNSDFLYHISDCTRFT